jgi:hypothetical protein
MSALMNFLCHTDHSYPFLQLRNLDVDQLIFVSLANVGFCFCEYLSYFLFLELWFFCVGSLFLLEQYSKVCSSF